MLTLISFESAFVNLMLKSRDGSRADKAGQVSLVQMIKRRSMYTNRKL